MSRPPTPQEELAAYQTIERITKQREAEAERERRQKANKRLVAWLVVGVVILLGLMGAAGKH
jgi:hypothetical protein